MTLPPRDAIERRFRGRHVLITGGSAGIGFALARRLITYGSVLTLVARDRARLELARSSLLDEVPDAEIHLLSLDVADLVGAAALPGALVGRPLDVLVNNAGVSRPGYFCDLSARDFQRQIEVNLGGVVAVTRALLPALARTRGHVVNVGSLSSVVATPGQSAYCSSKFALYGLSDVLRAELRPRGIGVSIVLPPETETKMLDDERPHLSAAARVLQASAGRLSADAVARATLRGVARGDFEIVPGALGYATTLAARWAPSLVRAYTDWVIRRLHSEEAAE